MADKHDDQSEKSKKKDKNDAPAQEPGELDEEQRPEDYSEQEPEAGPTEGDDSQRQDDPSQSTEPAAEPEDGEADEDYVKPDYVQDLESKQADLEAARELERECAATRAELESEVTSRRQRKGEVDRAVKSYSDALDRFQRQCEALGEYCDERRATIAEEVGDRAKKIDDRAATADRKLDKRQQGLNELEAGLAIARQELDRLEQATRQAQQSYEDLKGFAAATAASLGELERLRALVESAATSQETDRMYLLFGVLTRQQQEIDLPSSSDLEARLYECCEECDEAGRAVHEQRRKVDELNGRCGDEREQVAEARRRQAEQTHV